MTGLIAVRNSIRDFLRKYDEVTTPILRFIFSFIVFSCINSLFGYSEFLHRGVITFLLSVICALVTGPVVVFLAGVVVYSADELEHCLEEYKDYDLILVDTAGRSHKAEGQMDELMELIERTRQKSDEFDVDIYLTLSVTTKSKDLVSIVERYQDIKDWSVIFTKLDETCSLGNILNIRMITDAPLSYTTLGQNVPNDIEVIDKQALAKQLLGGAE